jgi:hypothetical protein
MAFGAVADYCKCPKCGHSFYASRIRTEPVEPTLPAEIVMRFVNVLSRNEPDLCGVVRQSIEQPEEFYLKYGNRFDWETSFDVNPIDVALEILRDVGFVGTVDWRASNEEIRSEFEKLCNKSGVSVSTVDDAVFSDDHSTDECLNTLAVTLAVQKLVLFQIALPSDEYSFGLLPDAHFETIGDIQTEEFAIRREFR